MQVVKPKKPKLIVVDRYDKIQYENIDEISKLAEQCAEKFEEAKKAQPALSALAAKMMHEMLKQFQDRLTLNTLESCKGNFERILKAKTLAKNQKMQAKADLSKHTTARKDAKFNKDDALAEVYGGEGDWDEDWDEEGWDDKGWYDDDGNWVEGEASDDKKEEEKKQQPAASSSSGPAADAFPALGGTLNFSFFFFQSLIDVSYLDSFH